MLNNDLSLAQLSPSLLNMNYFRDQGAGWEDSKSMWLHLSIGILLTGFCNILVILGIICNIHSFLIPWIILYFFGKYEPPITQSCIMREEKLWTFWDKFSFSRINNYFQYKKVWVRKTFLSKDVLCQTNT